MNRIAIAGWTLVAVGLLACGDDAGGAPVRDAGMDATDDAAIDASLHDTGIDGAAPDADLYDGAQVDADDRDGSDDDAGAINTAAEQCFADIAPGMWYGSDHYADARSFRSADGTWRLARARQPGSRSGAAGETYPYDLVGFWIQHGDDPAQCITDIGGFSYDFVHHNWDDVWTVTTADARYEMRETYELYPVLEWTFTFRIFDPTGTSMREEHVMISKACWNVPHYRYACSYF